MDEKDLKQENKNIIDDKELTSVTGGTCSSNKGEYKCLYCSEVFNDKKSLDAHEKACPRNPKNRHGAKPAFI